MLDLRGIVFLTAVIAGCSDVDGGDGKEADEEPVEPSGEEAAAHDVDGDGLSQEAGDCDDTDAEVNYAAAEICDGIDNDCDGFVDDEDSLVADAPSWFSDLDGDEFGDPETEVAACSPPPELIQNGSDCDDGSAEINPDADEVCDGIDNDCDGDTDDEDGDLDTSTGTNSFADVDGDGYGSPDSIELFCSIPDGRVGNGDDCDDGDAGISPAAVEICNEGVDDDCDGLIDNEDPSLDHHSGNIFYEDSDRDGYGNPNSSLGGCEAPLGYVLDNTDCNDLLPEINPAATEICEENVLSPSALGRDEDCDGLIDDDDPSLDQTTTSTWYLDNDRDTYGDSDTVRQSCAQPLEGVSVSGDCDDDDSDVNPGATEICNEVDDDCNGLVDLDDSGLDTSTFTVFYPDTDGDGYGDADGSTEEACTPSAGYVANDTDCDDGDPDVHCSGDTGLPDTGSADTGSADTGLDTGDSDTGFGGPVAVDPFDAVEAVFQTYGCGGGYCHGSGTPQLSEAGLIGQPSSQLPSMDYVEPGDPASSYLWLKINGLQSSSGGSGYPMPLGAGPITVAADLAAVEDWINGLAN
jgi:large repetitive protein